MDYLNSLLDKIDNNKVDKNIKPEAATSSDHDSNKHQLNLIENESLNWKKYYDNISGKFYYHNYVTNITTWDKPDCFQDVITTTNNLNEQLFQEEDYRAVAYFNKGLGRMSTTTYWEKMGRPADKSGRQLGVFMDLNELEENRIQAKKMKEEARNNPNTNIDWAKLKKEKQLKKRKASLLKD